MSYKILRNVYRKTGSAFTTIACNMKQAQNAPKSATSDLEANRLVWIDLELTGLDTERDTIVEIAALITDSNLNIVAQQPEIVIHHPQGVLDGMDEWCKEHHGKSGLIAACLKSTTTVVQAENQVLEFLKKYVGDKSSPLAGNSVYMDRIFLKKQMPKLDNYLHYRIVDVSAVKELCRRWNFDLYKNAPEKKYLHRSLPDIIESVEELKFYRDNFFKIST